jgi:hypothetical protein
MDELDLSLEDLEDIEDGSLPDDNYIKRILNDREQKKNKEFDWDYDPREDW